MKLACIEKYLIVLGAVTICSSSWAYEVDTHQMFSREALRASGFDLASFSNSQWYARFGFNKTEEYTLVKPVINTPILDMPPVTHHPDNSAITIGDVTTDILVEYGAILEDEDDRPLRHFLDPQNNNRGITFGVQFNSADWAIEDTRTTSYQRMSHRDLVQYYFQSTNAIDEDDRKKYMALVWQGIGHLIHHIQDMAQPQHVRNDAHCNTKEGFLKNCQRLDSLTGEVWDLYQPSEYEEFSNLFLDTLTVNNYYTNSAYYGGGAGLDFRQLGFSSIRDFWLRPDQGQAEFVSNNFVSVDTNFRVENQGGVFPNLQFVEYTPHPSYPLPNASSGSLPGVIERVTLTQENICAPVEQGRVCDISGDFFFIKHAFVDPVTNTEHFMNRFSSFGLWDDELTKQGKQPIFSMNRLNYMDRYEVLVPRAVGFSQGLIDYFFRGKISATISNGQLRVRNESDVPIVGTLHSYSDNTSGDRIGHQSISINLAPGQQTQNLDTDIYLPDNPSYTGWRALAFNGSIGNTQGVANHHFYYQEDTPEPVTCGSQIVGRVGGSEGYSPPPVNLGSEPGTVQVAFEAFSIPDAYEVRRSIDNQDLVSSNGFVSGYHVDSFNHSPDPNDPATFLVDLEVTGNSDTNTEWNITLGCPGDSIPDNRETVDFDVTGTGNCSASLFIDDEYVRGVSSSSGDFTLQLTAGAGIHTASLRNAHPQFCYIGTTSSYVSIDIKHNGTYKGSLGVFSVQPISFTID